MPRKWTLDIEDKLYCRWSSSKLMINIPMEAEAEASWKTIHFYFVWKSIENSNSQYVQVLYFVVEQYDTPIEFDKKGASYYY